MVYPTQYSKIVIEVKYCACPTSELNEWVIFVGKKANYGLSQNCLRDRRTLGMFFFSTFLLLSHVILPVSPVPLSPSPSSFFALPSVPFLLFYTLVCFIPVRILSPYPYHFLLSLHPVLHLLFLSSTLLPLCPSLICIIFIRLFYYLFFVSFDISCYKCYLIFY